MQTWAIALLGAFLFWLGARHEQRALAGERKRLERGWEELTRCATEVNQRLDVRNSALDEYAVSIAIAPTPYERATRLSHN